MEVVNLTVDQKAVNFDTMQHIDKVRKFVNDIVIQLLHRNIKAPVPHIDLYLRDFNDDVGNMNLVDLTQFLILWRAQAATLEAVEQSFKKTVETKFGRYGIDPQVATVMANSAPIFNPISVGASSVSTYGFINTETLHGLVNEVVFGLLQRGLEHDRTKLYEPEVDLFVKYTPELAKCHYGSPEYDAALAGLKPALDHHYANNRHHPEHFKDGIQDMNLIDVVEMMCDWKAATLRQKDGNLRKSIETNRKRFAMSDQFTKILENSMDLFDK